MTRLASFLPPHLVRTLAEHDSPAPPRAALRRDPRPEDLTEGELRWLRAHRPNSIPTAVMARLEEDETLRSAASG